MEWPRNTPADILICERGSPAGNPAEALGAGAARGSRRACWWWGASGALKKGRPPVCAGGTSASGAHCCPELHREPGQASLLGPRRWVPGSAARGLSSCSTAPGWGHPGRSAGTAARRQWSPARSSPCCIQCARWWVRSRSSLTGSACVWDDCCPSSGTSPRIFSSELPELRSQRWDPNTSLRTGRHAHVGVKYGHFIFISSLTEELDADTWGLQILEGGGDTAVVLWWAPGWWRGIRAAQPPVLLVTEQWHCPGNHRWLMAAL